MIIHYLEVPQDFHDYYINDFGVTGKSFVAVGTDSQNYIPNIALEHPSKCTILKKSKEYLLVLEED